MGWGADRCPAGSGSSSSWVLPSGFGKAHQAPVEGALLAIALTQAARDRRLHQLFAEIEGVRRVLDVQLLKYAVHVRLADERLTVERVEPVSVGKQPPVGVGDLLLHLAQLL